MRCFGTAQDIFVLDSTFALIEGHPLSILDTKKHLGRKKGGPPVIFQEVVHSIGTREADCDEQSSFRGTTEWTFIRMPALPFVVERLWFSGLLLVCDSRPQPKASR